MPADVVGIWERHHRVFTHDDYSLYLVAACVYLLGQGQPIFARKSLDAPCILHLLAILRNFAFLIAGIHIRIGPHVAGALDVVLTSKRIDANS